jgi:hypothetical protein
MVDWLAIALACILTAVIGLGFVFWEQFEARRLARERHRRRMTMAPALVRVRARHRLDVRRRHDRAA